MKINDRVYVSFLSRSKLSGEVGTIIGFGSRGEIKVKNDFGQIGYPKTSHVLLYKAEAKATDNVVYVDFTKPLVEDPTDLLCKVVRFETPFASGVMGWVSDQWIEDGVELLNVVHAGDFTVVPRSCITHAWQAGKVGDRVGKRII